MHPGIVRLKQWPYFSYVRAWLRSLPFLLGGSIAIGGIVAIWQFLLPDEYLCRAEFVPPLLEELNAFPYPRVVPGNPADLERTLSYLQSGTFMGELVAKFDLIKHYGIQNTQDPKEIERKIASILKRKISSRITKNSTILFEVYDEDPQYAYNMVVFALNKVKEQVSFYDRNLMAYKEAYKQEKEIERLIDSLQKRLKYLRTKYGIVTNTDIATGSIRVVYESLLKNPEALAYYDEVIYLESTIRNLIGQASELRRRRMDRELFYKSGIDPLWIIDQPGLPTTPARPKRFLIIALALVSSFCLGSLIVFYAYHLGFFSTKDEKLPVELSPINS